MIVPRMTQPSNSDIYFCGTARFVFKPTADVEGKLSAKTGELKTEISNLRKKLHYLETTYKNSREHIDQIFKSGGKS